MPISLVRHVARAGLIAVLVVPAAALAVWPLPETIRLSLGAAVAAPPVANADDDANLLKTAQNVFGALPKNMATAEVPVFRERVDLGRQLFFDPRISADGTTSCARCHLPH